MKYKHFLITFFGLYLIFSSNTTFALFNYHTTRTQLINFQPHVPKSNITKEGECWSESVSTPRPGAWRCSVGNSIYDPCFTAAQSDTVVCAANPITYEEGFILKLTKPLPVAETTSSIFLQVQASEGWLLKLSDGSFCTKYTGTFPVINGLLIKYACSDSLTCLENGNCPYLTGLTDYSQTDRALTAIKAYYSIAPNMAPILHKTNRVGISTVWH